MKSRVRWSGVAAMVVAGALCSPVCEADVIFLTQARSADATSWDLTSTPEIRYDEHWEAVDFSPADVDLHPPRDMGIARHTSVLSQGQIEASGYALGRKGFQSFNGSAEVDFELTFRVEEPTPYRWVGDWSLTGFSGGATFLQLVGPGTDIVFAPDYTLFIFSGAFEESGVLGVGEYTLTAQTSGRQGPPGLSTGIGTFDFTLSVPGPGAIPVWFGAVAAGLARRRR